MTPDTSPSMPTRLSRLERTIVETLYRLGEGSVHDVTQAMPGDRSYDSVRVTLGILDKKGIVNRRREGPRFVYRPAVPAERAQRSAAGHLTRTFFKGKPSRAILALLDMSTDELTAEELDEIARRIENERKKVAE